MSMANRLTAGDTIEFGMNVPDYPPADGWTLKMRMAPRFTAPTMAAFTLTATTGPVTIGDESFDYAIQVTPATSAGWSAGAYGWATWVEKVGARVTLEGTQYQGEVTVLPDPSALAQGADGRSQARKALDDALAAQASYASTRGMVSEYTIGDRRMKFSAAGDIASLITRLRVDVKREQRAEALAKCLPDPCKVYVRSGRA